MSPGGRWLLPEAPCPAAHFMQALLKALSRPPPLPFSPLDSSNSYHEGLAAGGAGLAEAGLAECELQAVDPRALP